MQKNVENKAGYKNAIYQEFVRWSALPYGERLILRILDQGEFARKFNVNKDTLTRWKNRSDFESSVDKLQKHWGHAKTPDIVHAIYRSAIKGDAKSQKLWMDRFTNFGKNKNDKEQKPALLVQEGDIRELINMLPDFLKKKHSIALRMIIDDASMLRRYEEAGRELTEEAYNVEHEDGL